MGWLTDKLERLRDSITERTAANISLAAVLFCGSASIFNLLQGRYLFALGQALIAIINADNYLVIRRRMRTRR